MGFDVGSHPNSVSMESLCRMPAFRPTVLELLRLLNGDDSASRVVRCLGSDPALCSEILTAANSAMYGASRRINTIARAVTMIGFERTKALATRVAFDGMLRALGTHPAVAHCWEHSRAAAVTAEWLAPLFQINPDRAYTTALMHDIGRLGLLMQNTSAYEKLLQAADGTDAELLQAERVMFTIDHCQAGLWLTRTWALPEEIQAVCFHHHAPHGDDAHEEVCLAALACRIAQGLGFKAAPQVQTDGFESLVSQLPAAAKTPSRLRLLAESVEREVGRPPVLPPGYPSAA